MFYIQFILNKILKRNVVIMSVLFTSKDCALISHQNFINQIFSSHIERQADGTQCRYQITSDLFELNLPYRNESNSKKRRQKANDIRTKKEIEENKVEFELIETIRLRTSEFISECHEKGHISLNDQQTKPKTNSKLREFLKRWDEVATKHISQFYAENSKTDFEKIELSGGQFLIPPNCTFYCKNIQELDWSKLDCVFDLIVMDPPWWNKYIRRTKQMNEENGYQMLNNEAIRDIPIEKLVGNKSIVAIWCTNAPSLITAVKQSFLKKWNLKLIATWYWIKITKFGEPICEFGSPLKKQPFERLFIACPTEMSQKLNIPDEYFIYSVPSAIHSHKPPLEDLLLPYLSKSMEHLKKLEIFSRYLLPHWTSIGLEVIKLQNKKLFNLEKVS